MYWLYFVAVIAAAGAVGSGKVPRPIRLLLAIGLFLGATINYIRDPSVLRILIVLLWSWWTIHAFFETPASKENT